jgi:response regulator RpfG family c-di-GMP phosphodiesterase
LRGTEIPLIGRIITIADVFDALISDRPYKKAWELSKAYEYILSSKGSHFDPELVECFCSVYQDILAIIKEYAD